MQQMQLQVITTGAAIPVLLTRDKAECACA